MTHPKSRCLHQIPVISRKGNSTKLNHTTFINQIFQQNHYNIFPEKYLLITSLIKNHFVKMVDNPLQSK